MQLCMVNSVFVCSQNSSWTQFVSAALLECVHHEKLQALTPYLQLEQVRPIVKQWEPCMVWKI